MELGIKLKASHMLGKHYTSEFLIPWRERTFFLSKDKGEIGVERKREEGKIGKRKGIFIEK